MTEILLNKLRLIQEKEGYISIKSLKKLSESENIPISKLYGVVTFYEKFYIKKPGKFIIELCCSPTCNIKGSFNLEKYLKRKYQIIVGKTTKDKMFTLKKVSCIGCCNKAPAMLLNEKPIYNLTEKKLDSIIKKCKLNKNANIKKK